MKVSDGIKLFFGLCIGFIILVIGVPVMLGTSIIILGLLAK